MEEDIISNAKNEFFKTIDNYGKDPYNLKPHVIEMNKWANYMCGIYPEANKEVILLAVWLHDIGHYPIPTDIDHAVRGEQRAKLFLEGFNYPVDTMKQVLHCIRSHRRKDVLPQTLEAKIISFIDSASHMTDCMYFKICKDDKEKNEPFKAYAKMKRDLRDLETFPEIKEKMIGIYKAWENLIEEYEKIDFIN